MSKYTSNNDIICPSLNKYIIEFLNQLHCSVVEETKIKILSAE